MHRSSPGAIEALPPERDVTAAEEKEEEEEEEEEEEAVADVETAGFSCAWQ